MSFILSCCSTADISREHFEKRNISYCCFHFTLDGVHYADDLGQSIPFDEFYAAMARGAETRTSQINADEFIEYFTPMLESGQDVLHISLSSGLSGAFNSANIAARELREKFPERKLLIVDSLGASSGYGLIMDTLADKRDEGMAIDRLYDWANENVLNLHHWFTSLDLTFYVKGGRISKAAGWFGTVLNICPVLNMDNEGHLIPREKVRSKKKALKALVDKMEKHARGGLDYSGKCFISNSACYEDAKTVADMIEARFPHLDGKVLINSIGTTIGSHTGPGTVALFFLGDKREN